VKITEAGMGLGDDNRGGDFNSKLEQARDPNHIVLTEGHSVGKNNGNAVILRNRICLC
jgi:hypothetical protein